MILPFFVRFGDTDIVEPVVVVAALTNVIYLTGLPNKLPFLDWLLSHSISIVFKI